MNVKMCDACCCNEKATHTIKCPRIEIRKLRDERGSILSKYENVVVQDTDMCDKHFYDYLNTKMLFREIEVEE
jgi:hypothetical protein